MFTLLVTAMLLAMATVPLSCIFSIKYGPALGSANVGRIHDLLSKTRSHALYLIPKRKFSLRFDLLILFCYFRVISGQSVSYCIGKIMSLPNTTSGACEMPKVVCTVVLLNAVADKPSSDCCVSSSSPSSKSKIHRQLHSTC